MAVKLAVEENDGCYTVHAVATENAVMMFEVNGKGKKPIPADKFGIATLELGKLKAGDYTVKVSVAGTKESGKKTVTVTTQKKENRPLETWDRIRMIGFWIAIFMFGPGHWWLTATYLAFALLVVAVVAKIRGKGFRYALWEENNWVFFAVLGMSLASGIMASMNPLVPRHSIFGIPRGVGGHFVWAFLNKCYFGTLATNGWTMAAKWYLFPWAVFAVIVSFWDNVRRGVKAWRMGGKPSSFLSGFFEHGKFELIFEGIEFVLKTLLGRKKP